ncbi:AsnC family transcriptional regulator, partial [Escherichia coli]|nr:AsnC family transcriptional regulator [Escherichia coli]
MDRTDKKIIAELQADGRLSLTELADKVGLSLSPCHRRVKSLSLINI